MKTIHILGNGASLNLSDMTYLKHQDTISFNRAYIAYQDWGFYPTYYMIIDKNVLQDCISDINKLIDSPIKEFIIIEGNYPNLVKSDKIRFVKLNYNANLFPAFYEYGYWGDVCVCSIQFLFEKGYTDYILHGVDCNYIEEPENTIIDGGVYRSKEDNVDPNHFRSDYFDSKHRYSKPYGYGHLLAWYKFYCFAKDLINIRLANNKSKLIEFIPVLDT